LPKQAYFNGSEYKGNGKIELHFTRYIGSGRSCGSVCTYTCAGYDGVRHECSEEEYNKRNDIVGSKSAGQIQNGQALLNLPTSIDSKYLMTAGEIKVWEGMPSAIIPEKNDCYLIPYLIKSGKPVGQPDFVYIVGNGIPSPFSKGWNFIYRGEEGESPKDVTNNLLSEMGCTLEWHIRCADELWPED